MTTQNGDTDSFLGFRMFLHQQFTGLYQIVHTFIAVGNALRGKQNDWSLCRQPQLLACCLLVARTKQVGIDGVRNICNGLTCQ